MCIPATVHVNLHGSVKRSASNLWHNLHNPASPEHGAKCVGFVMHLRGGMSKEKQKQARQTDTSTVMDLDEDEDADAVRRRNRGKTGLVLDGDDDEEEEEEGAARGITRQKVDMYKDGVPTLHCYSNKVVVEHANQPRLRKKRDVPVITAVGKITKRPAEAIAKRTSVNCSLPVLHGLFNVSDLAVYLRQRIKVNGEFGIKQNAVHVELDGDNIVVTATRATQLKRKRTWSRKLCLADAFSTRYIKYLIKKFICKIELKDIIRCVSTDHSLASRAKGGKGTMFEIKYTNIWKNRQLRIKISRVHGTRLEAARRELLDKPFEEYDDACLQMIRPEEKMIRRVKTTGAFMVSCLRYMLVYGVRVCSFLYVYM
jgi:hypothetical protein